MVSFGVNIFLEVVSNIKKLLIVIFHSLNNHLVFKERYFIGIFHALLIDS